jgi:hypothetical protein
VHNNEIDAPYRRHDDEENVEETTTCQRHGPPLGGLGEIPKDKHKHHQRVHVTRPPRPGTHRLALESAIRLVAAQAHRDEAKDADSGDDYVKGHGDGVDGPLAREEQQRHELISIGEDGDDDLADVNPRPISFADSRPFVYPPEPRPGPKKEKEKTHRKETRPNNIHPYRHFVLPPRKRPRHKRQRRNLKQQRHRPEDDLPQREQQSAEVARPLVRRPLPEGLEPSRRWRRSRCGW